MGSSAFLNRSTAAHHSLKLGQRGKERIVSLCPNLSGLLRMHSRPKVQLNKQTSTATTRLLSVMVPFQPPPHNFASPKRFQHSRARLGCFHQIQMHPHICISPKRGTEMFPISSRGVPNVSRDQLAPAQKCLLALSPPWRSPLASDFGILIHFLCVSRGWSRPSSHVTPPTVLHNLTSGPPRRR